MHFRWSKGDNHPHRFNQYAFRGHTNTETVMIMTNPSKRIEVPIPTRCLFTAELGLNVQLFSLEQTTYWSLDYGPPYHSASNQWRAGMNCTLKELMMMKMIKMRRKRRKWRNHTLLEVLERTIFERDACSICSSLKKKRVKQSNSAVLQFCFNVHSKSTWNLVHISPILTLMLLAISLHISSLSSPCYCFLVATG